MIWYNKRIIIKKKTEHNNKSKKRRQRQGKVFCVFFFNYFSTISSIFFSVIEQGAHILLCPGSCKFCSLLCPSLMDCLLSMCANWQGVTLVLWSPVLGHRVGSEWIDEGSWWQWRPPDPGHCEGMSLNPLKMHILGTSLRLFQGLNDGRLLREQLMCRWSGAVNQSWSVVELVWVSLWHAPSAPMMHCHPQSCPDGAMGFDPGTTFILCCVQEVSTRIKFLMQRVFPSVALIPKLKSVILLSLLKMAIT